MIRLAVRVRREDAELVLADLIELSPNGVEQVDGDGFVEFALYGAEGELPDLGRLEAVAGGAPVQVATTPVADDWADRWRQFHQPVTVGPLHVRPPWEPAASDRLDVVIDPGQAFGTGAHDTTRLCLELLAEIEPGAGLVDLGCGSGVLAIAAAKLGFAPVGAVDHELESVRATELNARANGVTVGVRRFDLLRGGRVPSAPTVVANILLPVLRAVARAGFGDPQPTQLLLSGLLPDQVDEAVSAFGAHDLIEDRRRQTADWAAVLLMRRSIG